MKRYATGTALVVLLALWGLEPARAAGQGGLITGVVRTGEGVPVSAVLVRALSDGGRERVASTDSAGVFGLPGMQAGRYRVEVSHLGYTGADTVVMVAVGGVTRVEFVVSVRVLEMAEIVVEGRRSRAVFEEEAGATVQELAGRDVKRLPGLAEADVLRAIEVLPGVVSTSDFSAAFNVRGGAADQNLILLDGIPVYNPFHLGGIFSVFNADMVRRAELLAGGFPARYGGRVSSVLTVEADPGVGETSTFRGGVSLLAARVAATSRLPDAVLSPLGLERGNVRVAARRSYFDQVLKPVFDFPYHLTDLQLAAEAWTGEQGRVTVTGYTGADVLDLRGGSEDFPLQLRIDWGNDVVGARWRSRLGGAGHLDVRLGYTQFATSIVFPDFEDTEFRSGIRHGLGAVDVEVPVGRGFGLGVGGELSRISYENLAATGGTVFNQARDEGWQGSTYVQGELATRRWLVQLGGRLDGWDPASTDAMVTVSPRLAVKRFLAGSDAALKLAAGRYTQFLHSLRDEEFPIGIDVWVTAGDRAPRVVSDQAQVGLEWFLPGGWFASVESYYRTFDGVITTNFADDPNTPDDDLLAGSGRSYGADVMLRRSADDDAWSGWATVSWLKAERSFPDRTSSQVPAPVVTYPPIYDRRVDLELVLRRSFGPLEAGLRWNFGTGLPYTRPRGVYTVYDYQPGLGGLAPTVGDEEDDGSVAAAVVLGPRNGSRYAPYHRLDVSFRRTYDTSWGSFTPYLDILNVYNRKNVLFYFFQYDATPAVRSGVSMLPFVPTLGAEVTF